MMAEHGQAWQLREKADGRLLATLHYVGQGEAREIDQECTESGRKVENIRLSRFAVLRFDPEVGMVLECPLGLYRLVLLDADVTAWVARLGHGESQNKHHDKDCPVSEQAQNVLRQWLWAMKAVYPAEEKDDATLAHWEFHDLLFHAQSRPGRRTGRIRPYRWRGVFEPLPLVKRGMGEMLALPAPDVQLEHFAAPESGTEKKFWDVLASRRSRRAFSPLPICLETLSTFLYHACRIQNQRPDELGGISFRPSPSAGALHGLELYVLTSAHEDVAGGLALYHYEALQHGLERLPLSRICPESATAKLALLAEQARHMAASQSVPAAYFISTARFRRYQWKYAQLAYSVMLKDLGSLHQTMSLCAEAMGLSSVILGDTPTDPFLELAGLDWLEESPVGSFSLGWPR